MFKAYDVVGPTLATTSEGLTVQVNKAVKYTKSARTTESTVKQGISEQTKNVTKTVTTKPKLIRTFNIAL